MLTTNLKLAEKYNYLDTKFKKAFVVFVARQTWLPSPLGNTPIDGEEVFANVQTYTTLPDADAPFESHEKYFDLQFVVSGEERFGYAPRDLSQVPPWLTMLTATLCSTKNPPRAAALS